MRRGYKVVCNTAAGRHRYMNLGNYISLCTRFLLKSRVEVQISTLDFTHKDTNKLFEINRFGIFYLGVSL